MSSFSQHRGGASIACVLLPHTHTHWKIQKLLAIYVQTEVRKMERLKKERWRDISEWLVYEFMYSCYILVNSIFCLDN